MADCTETPKVEQAKESGSVLSALSDLVMWFAPHFIDCAILYVFGLYGVFVVMNIFWLKISRDYFGIVLVCISLVLLGIMRGCIYLKNRATT